MEHPYASHQDEMILRDHLALDRTRLANERTALAYVRTFFASLGIGATFIHFGVTVLIDALGLICILAAFAMLAWGLKRYWEIRHILQAKLASQHAK